MAVLLAISIASRPDGLLHLTVLDIGQGDAILVESPDGGTMLIDGGPDPELTLRRIGANLPFFARRIDLLVLSHPHQDHVAGLVDVLDRFRVGAVLHAGIPFGNPAYDRLLTDAARTGVRVAALRTGQALDLGAGTTARDPLSHAGGRRGAASRGRHQQRLGRASARVRRLCRAC